MMIIGAVLSALVSILRVLITPFLFNSINEIPGAITQKIINI